MPNLSNSSSDSSVASYCVRGRKVFTPQGPISASIHIRNGVIDKIAAFDDVPAGYTVYDAGQSAVIPGVVDTHVHMNEPGRTEWEGFWTATQAAAAGGVTTLIDMPLNCIPSTTTATACREKIAAATGEVWVDVGFWGGIVSADDQELNRLWKAGAFGFKCFLVPTGVPEFRNVSEFDVRANLPALAIMGLPLLVHAEMPEPIEAAMRNSPVDSDVTHYATWLASRPRESEDQAISLLMALSREFNVRIHIVHLSSSDAIDALHRAKSNRTWVSVETCPHYLTFAAEEIPNGATEFKCAPPIRERENRDKLWAALDDGTIDMVVSDHSPCPPAMKLREEGNFLDAWGGIASLQVSLPAVWTEARLRGHALTRVIRWMCEKPAWLAGLQGRKGSIVAGADADLVIFNPDERFRVDADRLYHRHKLTPYSGRELTGVVEATFVRGQKVFERGAFSGAPTGRVLRRDRA
jgi:allantoinase